MTRMARICPPPLRHRLFFPSSTRLRGLQEGLGLLDLLGCVDLRGGFLPTILYPKAASVLSCHGGDSGPGNCEANDGQEDICPELCRGAGAHITAVELPGKG